MIKSLVIKNYALIQHLQMDPSAEFNTITGETGAGKSIMLGALGLLLGNRADTKVLFEEGKKCIIEGTFNIAQQSLQKLFDGFELDYQDETIIRREISPAGKSRAFINDTPVTLDVMKQVATFLVDIHSQRDTYLLGTSAHQMRMIDGYAQNKEKLLAYRKVFDEFKQAEKAYEELQSHAEEIRKESDYNHFLLEELDKVSVQQGELQQLEEELKIIEHAEEIKSKLFECLQLLEHSEYSITAQLQQAAKNIDQVAGLAEHYEPLSTRIESSFHELTDIAKEIESESDHVEFDKAKQEEIQERIGLIYQLLQKHHTNSVEDLLAIREKLNLKVTRVLNLDDELKKAQGQYENFKAELDKVGKSLTNSRTSIFDKFKSELESLLSKLAMPHASIDFKHEVANPTSSGVDKITILFSANAGIVPDELKNVASGGEFSRLMFCIKFLLAGKTSLPTIIFDEIDTGISGEVALKLVNMMKKMSKRHQVIAITHLPQIAASGDLHYYVYKNNDPKRSVTNIKILQSQEREIEIAKMIAGENPTEIALENAKELLKN